MIRSAFGLTKEPFHQTSPDLLPQQSEILEIIKIHAQYGGFSVVIGATGVGKTVLREHIQQMDKDKGTVVVSFSRTMHTYLHIIRQLGEAFSIDINDKTLEKDLIKTAYSHIRNRKTLYTLIDEAHLLDMSALRKLRLLFDQFPKNHNLILFGQQDLMHYLTMNTNQDIKSRITYSKQLLPLSDHQLAEFITAELTTVGLGANTCDEAALSLIIRSAEGNLRLCRNLCHGSLIAACRDNKKIVTISHVNTVLIQPHWRSHEALIKQQVPKPEEKK